VNEPDTVSPDPTGPDLAGPDPAGPDPAGPDPARSDPAGPDPARSDPTGPDPAGSDPARSDPTGPDLAGAESGEAARPPLPAAESEGRPAVPPSTRTLAVMILLAWAVVAIGLVVVAASGAVPLDFALAAAAVLLVGDLVVLAVLSRSMGRSGR
jgi:hypothetical protein